MVNKKIFLEKPINLDYNGSLVGFYEANFNLSNGENVDCRNVHISKADHEQVYQKLKAYYAQAAKSINKDLSPEAEISFAANCDMLGYGPSVDEDVSEGTVRLLEGYVA